MDPDKVDLPPFLQARRDKDNPTTQRNPDVIDAEFRVVSPEPPTAPATEKGGIFDDINSVNQLAADLNAKLDNKIVADEKYIPALKSAGRTSSEQKRISDELGQLRLDKDRNFKLRENLNRLDYYLRNAAAVETQRDQLSREGKNPEELKKFEEQNIPAEARGQIILPPEAQRNDVEKAYGEKVDAWIDAATAAQDKARAEIAEKNMPESERRIKNLERQLAKEKAARELAENRLVVEQATRKQAEQAREAAIADAQRLRDEAARLNTERVAAEIERDHLLTPPPGAGEPNVPPESLNGPSAQEIAENPSLSQPPQLLRPDEATPGPTNETGRPPFQERQNRWWRLAGNTAIGAFIGTSVAAVGTAATGGVWQVGAAAAGGVRSGIDRVREIGAREGLANVMSREMRGGRRGRVRPWLEAFANFEAEMGRQAVRAVSRVSEIGDRGADLARNIAGNLILDRMQNGERTNEQFVKGIRGAFDTELENMVTGVMERDSISKDDATARVLPTYAVDLAALSSRLRYETAVGGYKITDLLRQNGVDFSRGEMARTNELTQAAVETQARQMVGRLRQSNELADRQLADELIQYLAESRNTRIDSLRLVYAGAGVAAGAAKAVAMGELFYRAASAADHFVANEIIPRIFPQNPIETPPPPAPTSPAGNTPEARYVGGHEVTVQPGDTWGGLLAKEYGVSRSLLWGWGPETGAVWADKYLPALVDPVNASDIQGFYATASKSYPFSKGFFDGLGYDPSAGTFDAARMRAFDQALRLGDDDAIGAVKSMAHVLRPGPINLPAK